MVLETDQKISSDIVNTLENISGVIKVTYFDGEK
jgi:hypothetical protein